MIESRLCIHRSCSDEWPSLVQYRHFTNIPSHREKRAFDAGGFFPLPSEHPKCFPSCVPKGSDDVSLFISDLNLFLKSSLWPLCDFSHFWWFLWPYSWTVLIKKRIDSLLNTLHKILKYLQMMLFARGNMADFQSCFFSSDLQNQMIVSTSTQLKTCDWGSRG